MNRPLSLATAVLLTIPPLMWAANAVVGRLVNQLVPPITLNLLRWTIAFLLLLPFAWRIFRRGSGLWTHWRTFSALGLLGIGTYNALQYLALHSSTPINVTLVAASMPVWMLATGWLFFDAHVSARQIGGAVLSIGGVLFVLSRGSWQQLLALHLVPGDLFMLLATMAWSVYSWLLAKRSVPPALRGHWAAFLLAQLTFGVAWSGAFAAAEWALSAAHISWGWPLAAALVFIAIGPAIIAYRCWGVGVQRVGPNIAAFFNNLTPLFAAIMSSAFLGELPHLYHAIAFVLIVAGIVLSSTPAPPRPPAGKQQAI